MAVRDMVARHMDYEDTKDFIPTPPWAVRVLYECVAPELKENAKKLSAWDPAFGKGHMMKVMKEYGHNLVLGSDVITDRVLCSKDIEDCEFFGMDFVSKNVDLPPIRADVIITNPPYKYGEEFIREALARARFGVGMLMRIQVLEGESRYNNLYLSTPPTQIAFFSNRIPFKKDVVVRKAPKMFFHVWLWWSKDETGRLVPPRAPLWIPYNAQQGLEKDSDYE